MQIISQILLKITCIVSFVLFLLNPLICDANTIPNVPFSHSKKIKSWTSAYWKDPQGDFVRIASEDENNKLSSIHIDMDKNLLYIRLSKFGNKTEVEDFFGYLENKQLTDNILLRIDKNQIIKVQGIIYYQGDNLIYNGALYLKNVPDRFIYECKQGNILRIELKQRNGVNRYLKFSLSGFNASFSRAISLLENTQSDKDFFN